MNLISVRWSILGLALLGALALPSLSNAAEPYWSVGGQVGLTTELWKNGEGSSLALPAAQVEILGRVTGALELGGEAAYYRLADEATALGHLKKSVVHVGPVARIGRRMRSRSLYGSLAFGWYRENQESDSPLLSSSKSGSGAGGNLGLGKTLFDLGNRWAVGLEVRGHLAFWSDGQDLDGVSLATLTAVVRRD